MCKYFKIATKKSKKINGRLQTRRWKQKSETNIAQDDESKYWIKSKLKLYTNNKILKTKIKLKYKNTNVSE